MSKRDEYLAEALHRDGDAIMDGLGYKRQPDGEWREEDIVRMWQDMRKRGLAWAYKASGLIPE